MQKITSKLKIFGFAVITLALALLIAGCNLFGTAKLNAATAVNKNGGLALKGYDPVAYFTENKPVLGKTAFTHEWNGAKWQFATADNRAVFVREPEKYAPQYGGYCAWAVSHGYTADTDPLEAWKIVDGKLYLNYNKDVAQKWNENIPKYIADANQNWQNLAGKAEESRKDK